MTTFDLIINDKPKPAVKPCPVKFESRSKHTVRVDEVFSCVVWGTAWQLSGQSTSSITIRIASRSIDLWSDALRLDAIDGRGDCDLLRIIGGSLNWVETFRFNTFRSSVTPSYISDTRGDCNPWWLLVAETIVTSSLLLLLSWGISEHERRDDLLTLTFAVGEVTIASAKKNKQNVLIILWN
jgi:hypothetical protein